MQKADATRVDNEPPFSVVVNREEQDCIGSKDKQLPGGNKAAGKDGKRSEYPESIKEMWTEIGSLGLRIRIGAPLPTDPRITVRGMARVTRKATQIEAYALDRRQRRAEPGSSSR